MSKDLPTDPLKAMVDALTGQTPARATDHEPRTVARRWRGLTDEERSHVALAFYSVVNPKDLAFAKAIEARLRDRNS